ncbi:MAG: hypothetical protein WAW13_05235 [Minisyncoccia bacterium]
MIAVKDLRFTLSATKRETFERLFPLGAEVTVENARRATDAGLSLRCGAEQLMRPRKLQAFQERVRDLLALYLENTADTRKILAALNPWAQKLEWMDADTMHSENKRKHWSAYLDELAMAFVKGFPDPTTTRC